MEPIGLCAVKFPPRFNWRQAIFSSCCSSAKFTNIKVSAGTVIGNALNHFFTIQIFKFPDKFLTRDYTLAFKAISNDCRIIPILKENKAIDFISIKDLAQAKRFTSEPAVDEYNRYMNLI